MLRVRLPVVAAGIGALAGIGYTLLTGAEVPTVRSCIGALLVLGALALGREPLSHADGGGRSGVGAAALAGKPGRAELPDELFGGHCHRRAAHMRRRCSAFWRRARRAGCARGGRRLAMLLLTGVVIELALMPIVLFHFHRAGLYGALANVVAIPLVTFVSMPLIALALAFDTGRRRGAVLVAGRQVARPVAGDCAFHRRSAGRGAAGAADGRWEAVALFVAGGLWLALWRGGRDCWGLRCRLLGTVVLLADPGARCPDHHGDGRHVGIVGEDERLLVLRDTDSDFTRDNLLELAGVEGEPVPLD